MLNRVHHNFKDDTVEVFCNDASTNEEVAVIIDQSKIRIIDAATDALWFVCSNGGNTKYAQCHIRGKQVYMHRLLVGAACEGKHVHHKDGNGINNRMNNLQPVTPREHRLITPFKKPKWNNKSGYLGVALYGKNRFKAFHVNGKTLGIFPTAKEAYECSKAHRDLHYALRNAA